MSSLPEVIFTVSVSDETCQVHASVAIVRSPTRICTSRPASALVTSG